MVPGRIPDIEGARLIIGSFLHPAGLISATAKHKFTLVCEHDPDTNRLRLVPAIPTPGVAHPGAKILLIYFANPYSSGSLAPKLGSKSTPTDRDNWIKSILPQIMRLEPVTNLVQEMDTDMLAGVREPPGPSQNVWQRLGGGADAFPLPTRSRHAGTSTGWGRALVAPRPAATIPTAGKLVSMRSSGADLGDLNSRGYEDTGTSSGTARASQL